MGNPQNEGIIISRCEGDCDLNDNCAEGLQCYERTGDEPIPGCSGTPRNSFDYCIDFDDSIVSFKTPFLVLSTMYLNLLKMYSILLCS